MKKTLWTKNYTLLILATVCGSIGSIAGGFALSFRVFDETGSTLASALIQAVQFIPGFFVPLIAAPWLDRLPRKPFLVAGDGINGVFYALAGIYLLYHPFHYGGYLAFSFLLACLGSFDSLAYRSIYPGLIPEGMESKGYTVSSMLYPVLQVVMMPLAAVLMEKLGVARILIAQGGLSILAAVIESRIRISETSRMEGQAYSLRLWRQDIREASAYLRQERGLRSIFNYMAVTNGMGAGYGPLLVAFFRVTPGFSSAMYALFSGVEFIGRSLGGLVHYHVEIPEKKRYGFAFSIYQIYEAMDMCLLWLPYPLMLVNRGICGFLGINSAAMRETAVQSYIPDHLRARVNAYGDMLTLAVGSILTLLVGSLGEILNYRLCMTMCAGFALVFCWLSIWGSRKSVRQVFETKGKSQAE